MNMAVDALPVMTAPPEKAYFKNKEFSGTSENDADKTKRLQIVYLNSLRHITSKIKHK